MTIGARDDNTKALLLSSQRTASKQQVSMAVPPEPKLSYTGPLYMGDNTWDADGQVLSSAHANSARMQGAKGTRATAQRGGLNAQEQGKKGADDARKTPSADKHLSSTFLRKEAPGLARGVDTVGDIARNTATAFRYGTLTDRMRAQVMM